MNARSFKESIHLLMEAALIQLTFPHPDEGSHNRQLPLRRDLDPQLSRNKQYVTLSFGG